jgi:hypothetical protein
MRTATVTHLARSKALPLSYGEKVIHLHMITILTNTELPAHFFLGVSQYADLHLEQAIGRLSFFLPIQTCPHLSHL